MSDQKYQSCARACIPLIEENLQTVADNVRKERVSSVQDCGRYIYLRRSRGLGSAMVEGIVHWKVNVMNLKHVLPGSGSDDGPAIGHGKVWARSSRIIIVLCQGPSSSPAVIAATDLETYEACNPVEIR